MVYRFIEIGLVGNNDSSRVVAFETRVYRFIEIGLVGNAIPQRNKQK